MIVVVQLNIRQPLSSLGKSRSAIRIVEILHRLRKKKYTMRFKEIVVLSCIEAEDFECGTPWACISIATTENDFVRLHRRNRKDLLRIAFSDVCKPIRGFIVFDSLHAHDILDFVTHNWRRLNTPMVHCEAGLSRSPAVAAAILNLKLGDGSGFFEYPFIPNDMVISPMTWCITHCSKLRTVEAITNN